MACVLLSGIGLLAVVDVSHDAHAVGPELAALDDPAHSLSGRPPLHCRAAARLVSTGTEQFCAITRRGKMVRHGSSVRWSTDTPSKKLMQGEFRDGARDGLWIEWHASGQRKSELHFVEGNPQGSFQRWFESGATQTLGEYLNGEKHGRWTEYFEDGRRSEEGDYWIGARQGGWTGWFPSGQKRYARMHTANGTDTWKTWNEVGEIVDESGS